MLKKKYGIGVETQNALWKTTHHISYHISLITYQEGFGRNIDDMKCVTFKKAFCAFRSWSFYSKPRARTSFVMGAA